LASKKKSLISSGKCFKAALTRILFYILKNLSLDFITEKNIFKILIEIVFKNKFKVLKNF